MSGHVFRIVDANFNRLKEGLRVCEDVLRFVYDDKRLTASFKELRHECTKVLFDFPVPYRSLVEKREAVNDVGKNGMIEDKEKPEWEDIVIKNLKRSEESLPVIHHKPQHVFAHAQPLF